MNFQLPTLVIVGRPNVGKSTLFNRVVRQKMAVVEDSPGITRDRLYSEATWNGKSFKIVDTGGILFSEEDPLIEQIRVQAQVALTEADVILFVTDCNAGINPADIDLANHLRQINKPIILAANKADNPKRVEFASEFYQLGIADEVHPVSGLHGLGVADLLDTATDFFEKSPKNQEEIDETRLAIIGRPNVGKSSLLNAFTGEKRAIVSDIAGTTRDAIDTMIEYQGESIRLIDTAGLRRKGKIQGTVEYYMVLRANRALKRADCAVVLIDGEEGLTDGDKRTAKLAHDMGKAVVLAVNKWDTVEPPHGYPKKRTAEKKAFEKTIRAELPEINYAPICFLSAKESTGMEKILDLVFIALESRNFRISTGRLNKLIQDALFDRPLTRRGRDVRIYYATQTGIQPPTFALFCNNPDLVHFSYVRYLENKLREAHPLIGTSIRFDLRSSRKKDQE